MTNNNLNKRELAKENRRLNQYIKRLKEQSTVKQLLELKHLNKEIHKDYDKTKLDFVNQSLEIVQLKKDRKKLKKDNKILTLALKESKKMYEGLQKAPKSKDKKKKR